MSVKVSADEAEGLGPFQLVGDVGVVEDQRMQVAVAGMEDVGDFQTLVRANLRNFGQNFGQPRQRNGAVHTVVVGDPAKGSKR